jgi:hypothetical protein
MPELPNFHSYYCTIVKLDVLRDVNMKQEKNVFLYDIYVFLSMRCNYPFET